MARDKIVLKLKAKAITPIHVGGAQEKHYVQNLDYVKDGDTIYFLDDTKLIHHFGIDKFSHAVATNTVDGLLKSISTADYSKQIMTLNGDPGQEIKRHIRNPLSNTPYLPGSSLKGAIRSVILNYLLFKNKLQINGTRDIDKDVFGKISDDAMRFIQIVDAPFEKTRLYNTKIMNLQEDKDGWFGGWKQSQKQTSAKFSEKGFTSGYECIDRGQEAKLSIILNLKAFRTAKNRGAVKTSYFLEELFSDQFEAQFLEMLQKYMAFYLKSELKFVETYKEYDCDESIVAAYKKVQEKAQNHAMIRLGAGSGFHAMTGDWQYDDHTETGFHQGGRNHGKKKYKSRKFAFEYDSAIGDDGDYVFFPMGFLQLEKI